MSRLRLRTALAPAFVLLLLPMAPVGAQGQDQSLARELQESRRRLDEIQGERLRLQREMEALRSQVRDASAELRNIERQISVSRSALAEVELQVETVTSRIEENTRDLLRTRERLAESQATLNRRLRNIYKRGPLHSVRVLLGADSFSDLLNRYRYLEMLAAYDRSLVRRVADLEGVLVEQSQTLQGDLSELGRLRQQRLQEMVELQQVESTRLAAIGRYRSQERVAMSRLETLEADEGRLTDLIGDLERRRIEEDRRRAAAPTPTRNLEAMPLGRDDAGLLDWPVDGEVVYRFGRDRRSDGTVLRWNGVGIGAAPGTPVRAVRPGRVVLAGPFEGYGPTVILSHGEGFYTLYLYLEEIGVVEGREVEAGQVVGTVGGEDTPEGPHIEFQIRTPAEGSGVPRAQDPLQWLRRDPGDRRPGGGG